LAHGLLAVRLFYELPKDFTSKNFYHEEFTTRVMAGRNGEQEMRPTGRFEVI